MNTNALASHTAILVSLALLGCSSESSTANPPPLSKDAAPDVSLSDAGGDRSDAQGLDVVLADLTPVDQGNGCVAGDPCEDGGVCAGGVCCDERRACGSVCCDSTQVCSFEKCVGIGIDCFDSTDCAEGEYCEYSIGTQVVSPPDSGSCVGAAQHPKGKCLPSPPICAADAGVSDGGLTCLEKCQYVPSTTNFDTEVKYYWGGEITTPYATDIMSTPIVMQLDDDDCDSKITANDIPDIIFNTFSKDTGGYTAVGTLHAISVIKGAVVEKPEWKVEGVIKASSELAAGNIDGLPGNEVVVCKNGGGVVAFTPAEPKVKQLWSSEPTVSCRIPSIADMDGDGQPEVIVEGGVLDGKTGKTKHVHGGTVVADLDGDGKLEVTNGVAVYNVAGDLLVHTNLPLGTRPAVADLDKDGKPEIVVVDYDTHMLSVWRYDPTATDKYVVVRQGIDINGPIAPGSVCTDGQAGFTRGGGPPTIADFNGDGFPDVGMAGGVGYAVFDGKKLMNKNVANPNTILWIKQTHDCSSASTGSSVFDFNGDGQAEVVYSDEDFLRIYNGADGKILLETCNTTGTLLEYPVIADVDNDGQADIVVVSNAYSNHTCPADSGPNKMSGLRILGSKTGTWVRTRRVWNQHPYHITNVEEDGTIPAHEKVNWLQPGLNNYRQNKQPGNEFAAPDAVVTVVVPCGALELTALVRNVGEAALPPGVVVTFYSGNPPSTQKLGEGTTTLSLYPAQAEKVTIKLANPPSDVAKGNTPVYASLTVPAAARECRPDNNTSPLAKASCSGPK